MSENVLEKEEALPGETDDVFEDYETSESDDLDKAFEANELMRCKFLLNEYESNLLRIPLIKLYFTERDKKRLPLEARLLPFSCRLPKQLTRGPFIFGEGTILRRIDEDSNEELFDFEEIECNESTSLIKDDSNETITANDEKTEAGADIPALSLSDGNPALRKRYPLDTIYEGTSIDERIFEFPLTRSQRKVIPESMSRLPGIAEVRRINEMAEESVADTDELDPRIWLSDDTPFYCRKIKKASEV